MCGIAGWVDFNRDLKKESPIILRMSETLRERGADASGIFITESAAILQRRLIVVDKNGGVQPMTIFGKGQEYVIACNGGLFNAEELRRELIVLGYDFEGRSDVEVILNSYIEWGQNCLKKFNGAFAFAIWEKKNQKLFLARDRIGVKPLFFYNYGNGVIFASEIKTIMANGIVPAKIDSDGLRQILLLGPGKICGSGCIKNIEELKPAQYLCFERDYFKVNSYWRLKAFKNTDTQERTIETTRFLITDSIQRQLKSDVPLACFLSGGLDSSIISAIVAERFRETGKKLTTFSVDYKDNEKYFIQNSFQPSQDKQFIEIMTKHIGSEHKNIVLESKDLAESLEAASKARDLPGMADIDSSLLLFCKEIKKTHTVCLSGECADEIFGGYPWYHNKEILFKDTFPWSNSIGLRKSLFNCLDDESEDFVRNEYQNIIKCTDCLEEEDKYEKRMREMFMLNFYSFMQTLIDRNDRMSVHAGIEARVPFCDYRLVEYAFNMPWKHKSLNGREKGIVREAFKCLLPSEIIERKKSPYPKTFDPVFLKYVKQKAEKLVSDKKSVLHNIVNRKFFNKLKKNKAAEDYPWYGQLMRLPQIYAYLIQIDAFFQNFKLEIV